MLSSARASSSARCIVVSASPSISGPDQHARLEGIADRHLAPDALQPRHQMS
jgi:hypothetical protein